MSTTTTPDRNGQRHHATLGLGNLPGPQLRAVERLLAKGWIEPWLYRRCVYLFLPDTWHRRNRGVMVRDYRRPPIRVTPTGRILAGY